MLLKRLYDHSEPVPRVTGLRVLYAGSRQKFTVLMVEELIRDGFMSMEDQTLILRVEPRPLRYRIIRGPGFYCCYCNTSLAGSDEARRHITRHDASVTPDPQNPSGYRQDHFYDCVREDENATEPGSTAL